MEPLNLFEYEQRAKELLSKSAFDYFAGGAGDEITVRENRAAFERLRLLPRVAAGAGNVDLRTTVIGTALPFPVLVAPTAFQRLAHDEGEVATARGAGALGCPMVVSTLCTRTLSDIAAAATAPLWFQLYVYRDRGATAELVARAEASGVRAVVLTVDSPRLGRRERDVKNAFSLPPGIRVENGVGETAATLPAGSALQGYVHSQFEDDLRWSDVEWLRAKTRLPVLVKGVLRADDARRAVEHGAAAVIVSNHGGRSLDTVTATIDAVPAVADAVGAEVDVLMDGGVRRGADVLKALARGARAVLLGRPVLWGLAVGGAGGVRRMLQIVRDDLELSMCLCGCASIASIDRSLLI